MATIFAAYGSRAREPTATELPVRDGGAPTANNTLLAAGALGLASITLQTDGEVEAGLGASGYLEDATGQ